MVSAEFLAASRILALAVEYSAAVVFILNLSEAAAASPYGIPVPPFAEKSQST